MFSDLADTSDFAFEFGMRTTSGPGEKGGLCWSEAELLKIIQENLHPKLREDGYSGFSIRLIENPLKKRS